MKPIMYQFNTSAIVELYNTVDLIGISSYACKSAHEAWAVAGQHVLKYCNWQTRCRQCFRQQGLAYIVAVTAAAEHLPEPPASIPASLLQHGSHVYALDSAHLWPKV